MVTNMRARRKPRSLGSSSLGSSHYRLGRTHKMADETLSQRSTKNRRRRQVPAVLVEEIINMPGVGGRSKDLEGASVRDDKLAEARPRKLLAPMPLVRFQAMELRDIAEKETRGVIFIC